MQFKDITEGDFRIYAGALEVPNTQGFQAAVVVQRVQGPKPWRELFRDESVACGHRWHTAEEAIAYALAKGRDAVRKQQAALSTC